MRAEGSLFALQLRSARLHSLLRERVCSFSQGCVFRLGILTLNGAMESSMEVHLLLKLVIKASMSGNSQIGGRGSAVKAFLKALAHLALKIRLLTGTEHLGVGQGRVVLKTIALWSDRTKSKSSTL